ncbi:hypothetical protein DC083_09700 [Ignatzschineria ureiclastica]|uniref:Uncharacterized protein n=1 Tax=Ignatzschineria ureiclastica TaxID=472582 RepID=A0A2U2ACK4_9GAMM|nr:hypothetical protein [Ignatzschineria ureiclastica]PWD80289.1 hypothetical protein DC083_09700 [Ignatzschineria ureiclastica]GHA02731.1 hypothetical protein GCM10007162_18760 [Ignatzschineria ureiclastica]
MEPIYTQNQPTVSPVMTTKDWVITWIIFIIPVVGFIASIVWAIDGKNPNRTNFFRAYWIVSIAVIIILAILYGIILAIGYSNGAFH